MRVILKGVGADDLAVALEELTEARARVADLIHAPEHRDAFEADTMGTDPPEGAPGAEEMPGWRARRLALSRVIGALSP